MSSTESKLVVIRPGRRGWRSRVEELIQFRDLLWVLTLRDIKVRYKQTVLGGLWAVIQPVATMIVFSIFFGRLAKIPSDGVPYPVFVYSALLPWTLFANGVTTASNSMVGAANLVSKVYFPRLLIPLASIGAIIVDYLIATTIIFVMMFWYGMPLSANLVYWPLLTVGVVIASLGVGIWLAALTVPFRDFRYVVPFLIQIWLFVTPVVYGKSLIPEKWQWLIFLNPMAGIVDAFRSAFLGTPFDFQLIGLSMLSGLVIFACGVAYFERVESRFADII